MTEKTFSMVFSDGEGDGEGRDHRGRVEQVQQEKGMFLGNAVGDTQEGNEGAADGWERGGPYLMMAS